MRSGSGPEQLLELPDVETDHRLAVDERDRCRVEAQIDQLVEGFLVFADVPFLEWNSLA
jgi:hypothetical protein